MDEIRARHETRTELRKPLGLGKLRFYFSAHPDKKFSRLLFRESGIYLYHQSFAQGKINFTNATLVALYKM